MYGLRRTLPSRMAFSFFFTTKNFSFRNCCAIVVWGVIKIHSAHFTVSIAHFFLQFIFCGIIKSIDVSNNRKVFQTVSIQGQQFFFSFLKNLFFFQPLETHGVPLLWYSRIIHMDLVYTLLHLAFRLFVFEIYP